MNRSGIQAQIASDAFKQMVRATAPYCLKILDGARDRELVNEWAGRRRAMGGGCLILRYVTGDGVLITDLPRLTSEAIKLFDGWQAFATDGIIVILEIPINEKFQTDPTDFAALATASVPAATTIKAAGFTPGVLITSEGNPPGKNYGAGYFLQSAVLEAMRIFRRIGAIWCPHGYSHPPTAADDPWHFNRPANILAQLPEDARLNYAFGEMGCDGGCDLPDKKPGIGWEGYFAPEDGRIKRYADWARGQVRAIAADPLCIGGAFFLSGADPNGQPNFFSFDVRDEVDFRPVLTENVPGPAITRLQPDAPLPTPGPTPPEEPTVIDWCPFAIRDELPEGLFDDSRDGDVVPSMICDHIADGNGNPGPYWRTLLAQPPNRRASAHLWVAKSGELRQYVPFSAQAWSNGPIASPDLTNPLIAAIVAAGTNPNAVTISIEHEGKPGETFTAAQLATSRKVHHWLSTTFGIPLDRRHVVGHCQFDRITRANCPGPSFPWLGVLDVPETDPVDALRDQTFALASQLQALDPKWKAAGWPSIAIGISANAESVKSLVRASKGER